MEFLWFNVEVGVFGVVWVGMVFVGAVEWGFWGCVVAG